MKNLGSRKQCLIIISIILFLLQAIPAQTNIPGGNVSGTWAKANSPCKINGEITIPNDSTLTIEPGVEVVFMGHYKLNVQGRLLAIGTQKDTIHFRAEDVKNGWHGIRFISTPNTNDTSKIIYCSFKNGMANTGGITSLDRGGGAILISRFDKVFVSNCLFDSNMTNGDRHTTGGPGIWIEYASPIITKSTFSNNTGTTDGAIVCAYTSKATISNNIFIKNKFRYGAILCAYSIDNKPFIYGNFISNNVASERGGGIFIVDITSARIENNVIVHNYAQGWGGGIAAYNCSGKPVIINNTIAYNSAGASGGGIDFAAGSNPIFINNIIYGNSAPLGIQVEIYDNQSDPNFLYCDIQGGKEGFYGNGAGNNYTGIYNYNKDVDPLFNNKEKDDFHLSDSSPCIGAGTDSVKIGDVWYYAPAYDFDGNPRPNPKDSKPDIGAYENALGNPLTGLVDKLNVQPDKFQLYQNYPNPFNPNTSIQYAVGSMELVSLKVYDVLGNEVATLANEEKPAGTYEVTWNAEGLSSGVYFYTLKAGDFIATKKLVLMK